MQSLVRSIVDYLAPVWSPYTKCNSAMIQQLNWSTLELQRNYLKLIMLYKIAKGFVNIPSILLTSLHSLANKRTRIVSVYPPARIRRYRIHPNESSYSGIFFLWYVQIEISNIPGFVHASPREKRAMKTTTM